MSGRRDGGPTTDDAIVLSIDMLRKTWPKKAESLSGTISWRDPQVSVGFIAEMGKDFGHLRLIYEVQDSKTAAKRYVDQQVPLVPVNLKFGVRWFFLLGSRRCVKLYKTSGCSMFASRVALGLDYRSQRETDADRDFRRLCRLQQRLGADVGIDAFSPRPKHMRQKTYARLRAKIGVAHEVVEGHFDAFADKINARAERLGLGRVTGW